VASPSLTPMAMAVDPSGLKLVLYKEPDKCTDGWLRAALFHPDGKETEYGCWATDGNSVFVKWDDGMKDMIPTYVFESPDKKPARAPDISDPKNRNNI
jgi:hypothetical protein